MLLKQHVRLRFSSSQHFVHKLYFFFYKCSLINSLFSSLLIAHLDLDSSLNCCKCLHHEIQVLVLKEAIEDINTNEIQMDDFEPPKSGAEAIVTGLWSHFPPPFNQSSSTLNCCYILAFTVIVY